MLTVDKVYFNSKYKDRVKYDNITRGVLDAISNYNINDKVSLHSDIAMFYYRNSSSKFTYIMAEDIKEKNIFFKSLYLRYRINDMDSIALGLVPFNYGSFAEYSTTNVQQGNGLYPLIDTPLEGIHYIRKLNIKGSTLSMFKVGISKYRLFGDTINGSQSQPHSYRGTIVKDAIFEIRNGTYRFELNYFDITGRMFDKHVFDTKLYGAGIANESVLGSPLSLHAIYGYSVHNSYLSSVKSQEIAAQRVNPMLEYVMPEMFRFDQVKNSGHMYLIGAKYYILDAFLGKDVELGYFHQYVDDNFVSMNRGLPNSLFGGAFQRGLVRTYHVDFKINADINLVFRYVDYDRSRTEVIGNLNNSIDVNTLPSAVRGGDILYTSLYWKF